LNQCLALGQPDSLRVGYGFMFKEWDSKGMEGICVPAPVGNGINSTGPGHFMLTCFCFQGSKDMQACTGSAEVLGAEQMLGSCFLAARLSQEGKRQVKLKNPLLQYWT